MKKTTQLLMLALCLLTFGRLSAQTPLREPDTTFRSDWMSKDSMQAEEQYIGRIPSEVSKLTKTPEFVENRAVLHASLQKASDTQVTVYPFTEGFEGASAPPEGWMVYYNSGQAAPTCNNSVSFSTSQKKSGSQSFRFSSYDTSGCLSEQYLITPELDFGGKGKILKFYYAQYGASDKIRVGVSTTDNAFTSFSWDSWINNGASTFDDVHYVEKQLEANVKYVAIMYSATYNYYAYIDDFSISELPACVPPTALTATNVTYTTANLSWIPSGDNNTGYIIEYRIETEAAWTTFSPNPTGTSAVLTELQPNQWYQVRVRTDCGTEDGISAWSPEITFLAAEVTTITSGIAGPLTWTLTSDSTLYIRNAGQMPDYIYDSTDPEGYAPWHAYRYRVKHIVIGNAVTKLGRCAFSDMWNLRTMVTIPASVTSITAPAFWYCTNFTGVEVSMDNPNFSSLDGVLYNKAKTALLQYPIAKRGSFTIPSTVQTIGAYAFAYAFNSTETLTIPNSVTKLENYAFRSTRVETLDLPRSINSVTVYTFLENDYLKAINVDAANSTYSSEDGVLYNKAKTTLLKCPEGKRGTLSVAGTTTLIDRASVIYNCLDSVYIPPSVTSIGSEAFFGSNYLKTIIVPNTVNSISNRCFAYNYQLKTAKLPPLSGISDQLFMSCSNLENFEMPYSISSVGEEAFKACSKLNFITLPVGVESLRNNAFNGCTGLDSIVSINSVPPNLYDSVFLGVPNNIPVIINCDSLTAYQSKWAYFTNFQCDVIPADPCEKPYVADSTGLLAWKLCRDYTLSISGNGAMPNYIDRGAPWYFAAEKIKKVVIGDGVTSIGDYAFRDFENPEFTSLTIPNSVTYIGKSAFSYTKSLDSIIIPEHVNTIGENAFFNSGIKKANVPPSVINFGGSAFYSCARLAEIDFRPTITAIPEYTFYGCAFPSFDIPLYITGIGNRAFASMKLKSVTLPDGLTTLGDYAFAYCDSIKKVDFGSSLKTIGAYAFSSSRKLRCIELPATVTSIGDYAFQYCVLDSITCHALNAPSIGYYTFRETPAAVVITVPCESVLKYAQANYWSNLSNFTCPGIVPDDPCSILLGSGTAGTLTWKICSDRTLYIDGVGPMPDYNNVSATPWYSAQNALTKVVVGDSVTAIGNNAFSNFRKIGEVVIGDSVRTIGNNAFNNCAFTSLVLPEKLTSIGNDAFYNCPIAGKVLIPDSVKTIGTYAFHGNKMTHVSLGESVTTIGANAFNGCQNVGSIISKADSPATITANTFNGVNKSIPVFVPCNSLGDYQTAPNWNTFTNFQCDDVLANDPCAIPNYFGTSNQVTWKICPDSVLRIEGKGATSDYSTGSSNYGWFLYKDKFNAVEIGDSISYLGGNAFNNYDNIKSVVIGNSLKAILSGTFYDCDNLKTVVIGDSVQTIGSSAFYSNDSLKTVIMGDSVKVIESNAFSYCYDLTTLTLPNFLKSIGNNAFSGCKALTSLNLGPVLESIGSNAFYNCSGLTGALALPNSLKSIGDYAFIGCKNLTSVQLGTSLETIGAEAFRGCENLAGTIVFPDGLKTIDSSAFAYCPNLTGNVHIPASTISIANNLFSHSPSISNITVDAANPNYSSEEGIVYDKNKTRLIFCLNGRTGQVNIASTVTSIDGRAFDNCGLITGKLIVPEGVTTIKSYTFSGCNGITGLSLPSTLASMDEYAVTCTGLQSITVNAAAPPYVLIYAYNPATGWREYMYNDAFDFYYVSENTPLYVPCGSIETYKNAEGWKEFTNIQCEVENGINNVETARNLRFYPNPVHDLLHVQSDEKLHSVSLYSLQGKLLVNHIADTDNTFEVLVDMSRFANGIYLLRVQSVNGYSTLRVIKE